MHAAGPASPAILLDPGASTEDAEKHYQDFESELIAKKPRHLLHVPMSHVRAWAQEEALACVNGLARRYPQKGEKMAESDQYQERTERYHKEFAAQLIE